MSWPRLGGRRVLRERRRRVPKYRYVLKLVIVVSMDTRGRLNVVGGLVLMLSTACAGGDAADGSTTFTTGSGEVGGGEAGSGEVGGTESDDTATSADTTSDTTDTTSSTDTSTDATTSSGDGDGCGACDTPPGDCYEATGTCVAGTCEYDAKIAGTDCGVGGVCDSMGTCLGGGDCTKPHATGTMSGGVCGNWVCDTGWGDCNNDIDTDGCEVNTDTASANCGQCGNDCSGPNLTASCSSGQCERVCMGDYENCDGDWQNGCEIPTGVPQMCDSNGIRTDGEGCWTAYCGANAAAAADFGTYHCIHCANCNVPVTGSCRWCDSASGNFFPAESGCGCGSFEDLVCGP